MKSCTSFCEPKPSATPKMLAPASSGPMFTPSSLRPVSTTTSAIITNSSERSIGSSVRSRAARTRLPSRVQRCRRRSIAMFAASQTTSATIAAIAIVTSADARRWPMVPVPNARKTGTPQICSNSTRVTTPIAPDTIWRSSG